jgi:hypothetical protein
MIILGLFLIHVAEAVGAYVFFEWLVRWLGGVTMTEAVLTFAAVSGVVATLIILEANGRRGVIVSVAIIVFWSFIIFGATGTTAISILAGAVTALVVAAAVVLVESFTVRRRATRNPP